MRIAEINLQNNYNKIQAKKNSTTPPFKSAVSAEHYAMELMKIDNSEIARTIIGNNKELLSVAAVREFIEGFLIGVKNSPNTSQYEKNRILHILWYNFKDFIYLHNGYYRSMEERLQAHEPKCSFSDIADKKGRITETAMETAVNLSKIQGAEHYLKDYLAAAKDADGSIDIHVGYCVKKIINSLGDWHGRDVFRYAIYRDENKNVNRKFVDAIYHAPEGKISYAINHFGLKTQDEVFKKYEKENLYLPQNFYKLLQSLNENRLIYSNEASILDKEIGDYGKLLFVLPDIPRTEENKESYDKIIHFISSINEYEFDFNKKDKHGISFMEKVINSENIQLLEMIKKLKKKDLVFYPELDWAVNGVQNQEFKEKLKELDFKFEVLEKTAELRSIKAMQKFEKLLDSPLCDKNKMIKKIWEIASSHQRGVDTLHDFGKYISERFWGDEVSDELIFSILERIKQ